MGKENLNAKSDEEKATKIIRWHKVLNPLFLLVNSVFISLNVSGVFNKLLQPLHIVIVIIFFLMLAFYLYFIYLYSGAIKIVGRPAIDFSQETFRDKTMNQYSIPILSFAVIASFSALFLAILSMRGSRFPMPDFFIICAVGYVCIYFMLEMSMRAQKRILNDELAVIKTKDAGYYSYFYTILLLLVFAIIYLANPALKSFITSTFQNDATTGLLMTALVLGLIGGGMGRVTIWLKYR